jgi:hypothetical protein
MTPTESGAILRRMRRLPAVVILVWLGCASVWLSVSATSAGARPVSTTAGAIVGVVTSPSSDTPTDWDSPSTWSELATVAGIAVGGIGLFSAWSTRKNDLQLKGYAEQRVWGVIAKDLCDVIKNELTAATESELTPATRALLKRDRIKGLTDQVDAAKTAFMGLADTGNADSADAVVRSLGVIGRAGRELQSQYLYLHQNELRIETEPGNSQLLNDVAYLYRKVQELSDELLTQAGALPGEVGKWLEASKAVKKHSWEGARARPASNTVPPPNQQPPSGRAAA